MTAQTFQWKRCIHVNHCSALHSVDKFSSFGRFRTGFVISTILTADSLPVHSFGCLQDVLGNNYILFNHNLQTTYSSTVFNNFMHPVIAAVIPHTLGLSHSS